MGPQVRPLTVPVNTSFVPAMPGSMSEVRAGDPALKSAPWRVARVAFSSSLHGAAASRRCELPKPLGGARRSAIGRTRRPPEMPGKRSERSRRVHAGHIIEHYQVSSFRTRHWRNFDAVPRISDCPDAH